MNNTVSSVNELIKAGKLSVMVIVCGPSCAARDEIVQRMHDAAPEAIVATTNSVELFAEIVNAAEGVSIE